MDSPYDFVNYLTSGGADLVKGAVNPEDDFSKEHWLSSFGLASMVSGVKLGRTTSNNTQIIDSSVIYKANNGKTNNPKYKIDNFSELMNDEDGKRYNQFWDYVDKELSTTDRVKLMNWNYKPSGELYNRYKLVYDDSRYYNQTSGNINWPGQNGDLNKDGFIDGYYELEKLQPGNIIDRYGSNNNGQYFSPAGFSYGSRALPPHMINQPYTQYMIKQEFTVHSGRVAPWFNEVGKGIQYHSKTEILDDFGELQEATVQNLIEYGYLEPLERKEGSD